MVKKIRSTTKPQRHEKYNLKKLLCDLVANNFASGLSGLGLGYDWYL